VADWALWTRFRPVDRLRAGLGGATAGLSPLVGRRRRAFVRRPSPWLRFSAAGGWWEAKSASRFSKRCAFSHRSDLWPGQ
jgi:hypothetical protein